MWLELPILLRAGVVLVMASLAAAGFGFLSYSGKGDRPDADDPALSWWERNELHRSEATDSARFLLAVVPVGFVLLVVGLIQLLLREI